MAVQGAPRGVVTPEGVVLDFATAGLGSRTLARLIDLAVISGGFLVLTILLAAFGPTLPQSVAIVLVISLSAGAVLGYPVALETLWKGRTVGKSALGLRVVTAEGAPARFRHAAVRAILGLVDLFASSGFAGVASMVLSARNQRLGDLAAGTIVLRERSAAGDVESMAFEIPEGYSSWATTLDVSDVDAVDAADYALIRSLFVRSGSLRPGAAHDLARRVATHLESRIGSAKPPQMADDVYLQVVAARYQQRHREPSGPQQATTPTTPTDGFVAPD